MGARNLNMSVSALTLVAALSLPLNPASADQHADLSAFGGAANVEFLSNTRLGDPVAVEIAQAPILLAQSDGGEFDDNDPLEPLNRVIFEFNEIVYAAILDPIAIAYNTVIPDTGRAALSNVLANLSAPVTLVNNLLQFEFERAAITVARFVVNTTVGMGGIADVAEDIGLEENVEDFGQTLGVLGVGEGFYLVLPLLGPSNPRDAIGQFVVDPYFDPLGLWLDNTDRDRERFSRIGITALNEYAGFVDELDLLRRTSIDYYAALRSLYRQRRATQIANGSDDNIPNIPNYDINFIPEDGDVATTKR